MSTKLSKHIAAFDYFDKTLIILSAASAGISIISFTSVIGIPAGTSSASFSLAFSLATGIVKKLFEVARSKKKNHDQTFVTARSKLNSIEILVFRALIDLEISHEEFKTIINEKERYKKMKEDIRMIKSSDELNKEKGKKNQNNRIWRENTENA